MSDSVCPVCGEEPVDYAGKEPVEWACGRVKYGSSRCPHAERLLAEARATIARMTPVVEAAERWQGTCQWHVADKWKRVEHMERARRLELAIDAYRGKR